MFEEVFAKAWDSKAMTRMMDKAIMDAYNRPRSPLEL
jgi:hypothetical protein